MLHDEHGDHASHFPRIDEKRLSATISKAMIAFVASDEPKTNRNRRVAKKLARQRDHAINQAGFDDCFTSLAFEMSSNEIAPTRYRDGGNVIG